MLISKPSLTKTENASRKQISELSLRKHLDHGTSISTQLLLTVGRCLEIASSLAWTFKWFHLNTDSGEDGIIVFHDHLAK